MMNNTIKCDPQICEAMKRNKVLFKHIFSAQTLEAQERLIFFGIA